MPPIYSRSWFLDVGQLSSLKSYIKYLPGRNFNLTRKLVKKWSSVKSSFKNRDELISEEIQ
jgi:hypothetical protein